MIERFNNIICLEFRQDILSMVVYRIYTYI